MACLTNMHRLRSTSLISRCRSYICYRWKRRPRSQFLRRISILSDIRSSRNYAIHEISAIWSFGSYFQEMYLHLWRIWHCHILLPLFLWEIRECHQESMLRVDCASYLLIVLIIFSCIWICHSINGRLCQICHSSKICQHSVSIQRSRNSFMYISVSIFKCESATHVCCFSSFLIWQKSLTE